VRLIKRISDIYFISSVLLYLIFVVQLKFSYGYLYVYSFLTLIIYYLIIRTQLFKDDNYYTQYLLSCIIFSVGFLGILANNMLSYQYNDNFFVFSEVDAGTYHEESLKMISSSFTEGIENILGHWLYEDLGAVLIISTLYRIVASNLIVNFFYLVISVITGLGLFKIGRYLMPKRYAYISALTFSISSYFIWFNSSGLKESAMIYLVTYSFLNYYNFSKTGSYKYIFYLLIFLVSLLLFRPVIAFFILGSILISTLLKRKGLSEKIFALILGIGLIYGSNVVSGIYLKYMTEGGVSQMIAGRELEGMVKGSIEFTYMVNVLAGFIGPFPTILPNTRPDLSLYTPGLIFKIIISVPFLLGVFYILKRRIYVYFPIILFVAFESISLIFILESLELRKALPHFPFIYIVSFGYLSYLDSFNRPQKKKLYKLLNSSFFVIFCMIIYWNTRN